MSFEIVILGASFETGNMGVSALAHSLVKLFISGWPDTHISFFIGAQTPKKQQVKILGRTIEVDIVNYRMSPKSPLKAHLLWIFLLALMQKICPAFRAGIVESNPTLTMFDNAGLVGDIRGGDSFSDIYGLRGFIMGSLPSIIALLMGKKLILLPQTYGPYRTRTAKLLARWILSRAERILSRDGEGLDIARTMLETIKPNKLVEFCPDVAFALDPAPVDKPDIQPPLDKKDGAPLIGFNINGLLYNGGYTRDNMFGLAMDYKSFVHQLAEELLSKTNAKILFIPHTFAPVGHVESDSEASRRVLDSLAPLFPGRVHLVSREYNQSEIKNIIGMCNFFIGSRMHACIAALSQSVPAVAVAYSRKFKGVFDSVGVAEVVVDARNTPANVAIIRVMEVFDKRAIFISTLSSRLAEQKVLLVEVFRGLIASSISSREINK